MRRIGRSNFYRWFRCVLGAPVPRRRIIRPQQRSPSHMLLRMVGTCQAFVFQARRCDRIEVDVMTDQAGRRCFDRMRNTETVMPIMKSCWASCSSQTPSWSLADATTRTSPQSRIAAKSGGGTLPHSGREPSRKTGGRPGGAQLGVFLRPRGLALVCQGRSHHKEPPMPRI